MGSILNFYGLVSDKTSYILMLCLSLLIFLYPVSLYAQECVGDYNLTTQSEVDNFNCTSVTGALIITGDYTGNITNLDGLSELTSVGGNFIICMNPELTNIDGLASLTLVGESLQIWDNPLLTNIDGLSALTSIGGSLGFLWYNAALTNIDGLSALTSVGGPVYIVGNPVLTNIDGLASLTSVGGEVFIFLTDALTNIDGLASLTSVRGDLEIAENASLTNIDGLAALTSVEGGVSIVGNPVLTNIDGFAALTSVGGDLFIWYNSALTNIDGLAGLTSVGGNLTVEDNDVLERCCGLYPILSVGMIAGEIDIENNENGCNSEEEIIDAGPCKHEVSIDIKPGSYPNSINLKSKGKVTVAILTTDDFDSYDVDPVTCEFAGAHPLRWNMKDVDHDCDYDILFHFMTQELDLTKESTEATMECETFEGIPITGTDSINIVPKGNMHSKKAKKKK